MKENETILNLKREAICKVNIILITTKTTTLMVDWYQLIFLVFLNKYFILIVGSGTFLWKRRKKSAQPRLPIPFYAFPVVADKRKEIRFSFSFFDVFRFPSFSLHSCIDSCKLRYSLNWPTFPFWPSHNFPSQASCVQLFTSAYQLLQPGSLVPLFSSPLLVSSVQPTIRSSTHTQPCIHTEIMQRSKTLDIHTTQKRYRHPNQRRKRRNLGRCAEKITLGQSEGRSQALLAWYKVTGKRK